jgi:hypothetical protein
LRKIILSIAFVFVSAISMAQILSPDRQTDWTIAGYDGQQNLDFPIINFLDYGGFNDGFTANDALLSTLLNEYNNSGIIVFFPEGDYLFNYSIRLSDNEILRGESAEFTRFEFDLGGIGHCILATGNVVNGSVLLNENTVLNEYELSLTDVSDFQIGDYFHLSENDAAIVFSDWAVGCAGQINKIENIEGNNISTSYPIRRMFYTNRNAAIKKVNLVKHVGIENLTIHRLDETANQTNNIYFNYAANCWVSCIRSYNCNFSHIEISNSTNIEVTGSYFKDGFSYGSGGKAYGVCLDYSTGQCLIQDNIFEHLRHSMMAQLGANGNVFAYNYSKNPFWTEVGILPANSAGDLVLHGNYAYLNLFEGNIVQNIVIDDSHGSNGPFNTFFRNRAELYGIFMNFLPPSNQQNFIGNEITNGAPTYGLYSLAGTGHYQFGNNKHENVIPAGTNNPPTESFYLTEIPEYYHETWPPIGLPNTINQHTIEAKERYSNQLLTFCQDEITGIINLSTDDIDVFPSITKGLIFIDGEPNLLEQLKSIQVYDIHGKLYSTSIKSTSLNLSGYSNGIYLLRFVFDDLPSVSKKIIKY